MRRSWMMGASALALVVAAAGVWLIWMRDPGPVAPELTGRRLRMADRQIGRSAET